MQTAEKIYVTVTLDAWEDPMKKVSMHKLSYLSKKTIQQLAGAAKECGCMLENPEVLGKEGSLDTRTQSVQMPSLPGQTVAAGAARSHG